MIMSEQTGLKSTALFAFFPIGLLFLVQGYLFVLQQQISVLPLSLSLLSAQLICAIVFWRGDICPGQRGRLQKLHLLFIFPWLGIALLSLFSSFSMTLWLSFGCALASILLSQKYAAKGAQVALALLSLCLALNFYLTAWQHLPLNQILIGVILANLVLLISKSRLQVFIQLLALLMAVLLLLSLLTLLLNLFNHQAFTNAYAILLAFVLPLVMTAILAWAIFSKQPLTYMQLCLLVFMASSIPLWIWFAYGVN